MSDHETYAFDMLGYIVVPDVLTPEQLRVANAAIDQMEAGGDFFELEEGGAVILSDCRRLPSIGLCYMSPSACDYDWVMPVPPSSSDGGLEASPSYVRNSVALLGDCEAGCTAIAQPSLGASCYI
jgi:hypothetical protein